MAGHSKWANIKHRKAAQDNKRGKVFSKIAKEIMVCAAGGGGDPGQNITLRALIQKGRSVNMPADNIERAIKKGTGELNDGTVFSEIVYEGYAAGGVALVIETLTDNKNRTVADVKHVFTKAGANLATSGAVTRSFQRKGVISVPVEGQDEEALMELALENGAEDFEREGDGFTITTAPNDFMTVCDALNEKEIPIDTETPIVLENIFFEFGSSELKMSSFKEIQRLVNLLNYNNDIKIKIIGQGKYVLFQ